MKNIRCKTTTAVLAMSLLTWAGVAGAQQGPVGQGLNDAGRAVKRGFQTAGQAVQGGFQKTRMGVHNMEVVSRVYSRLHWDKALTASNIELEVQAGGIATLTGIVPDEAAKAKALMLTAETVGVIEVVDKLVVGSSVRPAPIVPGATPGVVTPPAPSSTIIVTPPPGSTVIPPPATTPRPRSGDTPL
jgi:hyperosmotically inducible periplasmic protein